MFLSSPNGMKLDARGLDEIKLTSRVSIQSKLHPALDNTAGSTCDTLPVSSILTASGCARPIAHTFGWLGLPHLLLLGRA
eukprot:3336456-Amphidinium_carterae.2